MNRLAAVIFWRQQGASLPIESHPSWRQSEMLITPIELKKFKLPPRVENSPNGDGCMQLDSSNRAHLLDHLLGLDQHERNS